MLSQQPLGLPYPGPYLLLAAAAVVAKRGEGCGLAARIARPAPPPVLLPGAGAPLALLPLRWRNAAPCASRPSRSSARRAV